MNSETDFARWYSIDGGLFLELHPLRRFMAVQKCNATSRQDGNTGPHASDRVSAAD